MNCFLCKGFGWVCESHSSVPFDDCSCGGAGMGCQCRDGEYPGLPDDVLILASADENEQAAADLTKSAISAARGNKND